MKNVKLIYTIAIALVMIFLCSCSAEKNNEVGHEISSLNSSEGTGVVDSVDVDSENEDNEMPYVGMDERYIDSTDIGVAELTDESSFHKGGELMVYRHYTYYYRYSDHTDIVFTATVCNGEVVEVNDYRSSPKQVTPERHRTMLNAGVKVNNKS